MKGYDGDYVFMLVEIADDDFRIAALSRTGQVIDSGVLPRLKVAAPATASGQ